MESYNLDIERPSAVKTLGRHTFSRVPFFCCHLDCFCQTLLPQLKELLNPAKNIKSAKGLYKETSTQRTNFFSPLGPIVLELLGKEGYRRITSTSAYIFNQFLSTPPIKSTFTCVQDTFHLCSLGCEALLSLNTPNAGGNSEISEAFSIDYFCRFLQAKEIVFENEVEYAFTGKMVDFVCRIKNTRYGVSVTRAMGYPHPHCFVPEEASRLLNKKLTGLILSARNVSSKHSFSKSFLHVFCQNELIAKYVITACSLLLADSELNTLMVIATVTDSEEVFTNSAPPFISGLL